MIFVKFNKNGLPEEFSHGLTDAMQTDPAWQSRWNWTSFETVEGIARYLNAMTGKTFLGSDAGEHTFPRFDVIEAPVIGAEVSEAFNGDCSPCGTIVRITKGWRITTSTGKKFNRRKNSASWGGIGGYGSMVGGHITERNPHF